MFLNGTAGNLFSIQFSSIVKPPVAVSISSVSALNGEPCLCGSSVVLSQSTAPGGVTGIWDEA